MPADRPSADVVAANVINGVMAIACLVAVGGTAGWMCAHAAARGDWDEVRQGAPFLLMVLIYAPRVIRGSLGLLRNKTGRETAG